LLVPSSFALYPEYPDDNMVDDHALENFFSPGLAEMIAGDEFIRFVVKIPSRHPYGY
jgi:hypothetical protein